MATVDKNFKVKHGLVVEGTTATVNGNDILTTASTITTDNVSETTLNQYFTDSRAKTSAADLLTNATLTNITITGDGNGLTITAENGGIQDLSGFNTDNLSEGSTNKYYSNTLVDNHLSGGSGISYSSGTISVNLGTGGQGLFTGAGGQLAIDRTTVDTWYDASGAASTAESNAKDYTNNQLGNYTSNQFLDTTIDGYGYIKSTALNNYATNSDVSDAAYAAEYNAKGYTDTKLGDYTKTSDLDTTVGGYGYIKSGALSGYATETYVGNAIADVVGLAPAALDTLQELAAAFDNSPDTLTNLVTTVGGKQDALTAGTGITLTGATISVTANTYDAYGAASTAESNANGYTDNAISNLPAAYVTSVGSNLDVTAGQLTISNSPNFTEVDVNSVAKQVASTTTISSATTATVYNFDKSVYRSAKFLVKVAEGTNTEVSEVLLTLDSSNNIAITEYAVVGTNGSLSTISADIDMLTGWVRLLVTTIGASTVSVSGTLLV